MKTLAISDIHSHTKNLHKALDITQKESIEHVFCLGDIIDVDTATILAGCMVPVTSALGNNDRDWHSLRKLRKEESNNATFVFEEEGGEVLLDNSLFFLTHYPRVADEKAKLGMYKAIFHGHTHRPRNEMVGDTRIVNPGDLLNRHHDASYAIYNTKTHEVEFVRL